MRKALLPAACALGLLVLSGCSGPTAAVIPPQSERPAASPTQSAAPQPTTEPTVEPTDGPDPTPTESPELPNTDPTPLPTDCRAMLTPEVLAQLDGVVPLNHPDYGDFVGPQANGSLVCMWSEPSNASVMLMTEISKMTPHEASVVLGEARDAGLECTELDIAVRCSGELVIEGISDPVGHTLFVRGGIVIDTQFVNLAPEGYTNAIIASIWPEYGTQ